MLPSEGDRQKPDGTNNTDTSEHDELPEWCLVTMFNLDSAEVGVDSLARLNERRDRVTQNVKRAMADIFVSFRTDDSTASGRLSMLYDLEG